jgi:hypothetical protein
VATVFTGLASKPVATVSSGLASKPTVTVFVGLTSKPVATVSPSLASKSMAQVSQFGPPNRQLQFGDLGHKIIAKVSWFGAQNQAGYGLLVAPQNRWEDGDDIGHAMRSSGLLHIETSQAWVS